jgi:hypothetical protein
VAFGKLIVTALVNNAIYEQKEDGLKLTLPDRLQNSKTM